MIDANVNVHEKEKEDNVSIEGSLETILSELILINFSVLRALINNENDLEIAIVNFSKKLNDKEVIKQYKNAFNIQGIEGWGIA